MEFDPYSRTYFEDPYPVYAWLRDRAPVYHNERYGFWALSRFADVDAAHRDVARFVNGRGLLLEQMLDPDYVNPGFLNTSDPPAHTRLRKLVSRVFTPRAIEAMEPLVRQVIIDRIDRLDGRDEFDVQTDWPRLFPADVTSAILGVPEGDWSQVRDWCHRAGVREEGDLHSTGEGRRAQQALVDYFTDLAASRRASPAGDLVSHLVEAGGSGGDRLDDRAAGSFLTQLEQAGAETTAMALGNGVVLFARHPDQWRRVLDDPGLIPGAVEEILRYWAPVQFIGRMSTTATVFDGGAIPAGVPVLLILAAANRDDREFDEPDAFDIGRRIPVALSLGVGIHACLGAALDAHGAAGRIRGDTEPLARI